MDYHSTYKGSNISKRSYNLGYHMKWSSYVNYHFVYADTLRGIKRMITLELEKGHNNHD